MLSLPNDPILSDDPVVVVSPSVKDSGKDTEEVAALLDGVPAGPSSSS